MKLLQIFRSWLGLNKTEEETVVKSPDDARKDREHQERIEKAKADPRNAGVAYSNAEFHPSKGILDTESLYPHSKKMYELPERTKAFIFEWRQMVENPAMPVEIKIVEASRVLDLFQQRSTMTMSFVRQDITEVINDFFYKLFLEGKEKKDNFLISIAASKCMRSNNNAYEISSYLASLVKDSSLDEQTRIEFADNLDLNCPFLELQDVGATYISEVTGQPKQLRSPIKGVLSDYVLKNVIGERMTADDIVEVRGGMDANLLTSIMRSEQPVQRNRAKQHQDRLREVYNKNYKSFTKSKKVEEDEEPRSEEEDEKHSSELGKGGSSSSSSEHSSDSEDELPERTNYASYDRGDDYTTYDDLHIYESTQNVHKEKISDVIMSKLATLERDPVPKESFFSVMKHFVDVIIKEGIIMESDDVTTNAIVRSITRISSDASKFEDINLSLAQVFNIVFYRILRSQSKPELLRRLVEELVDTAEFCSTGYMSRLVNVLSGFDVDPEVQFKASHVKEQIFDRVTELFRKFLDRCRDEELVDQVMEAIIDSSKRNDDVEEYINEQRVRIQAIVQEEFAANVFDEVELRKLYEYIDMGIERIFNVVEEVKQQPKRLTKRPTFPTVGHIDIELE